jgi:hypothetical protein
MMPQSIDQTDIDKVNQLLHYLKVEKFSSILGDLTKNQKKWCPFQHGDEIDPTCYFGNPSVQNMLQWMTKYTSCCKFIDANRYSVDEMSELCLKLRHPELLVDYSTFRKTIVRFKALVDHLESDISEKIDRMTCQEAIRLDEALVCFENYCFFASVIMAVSAVESRIMEMIRRRNKTLYTTTFTKATLGQLIQVFDDNKYTDKKYASIKKRMPDKYKPLIALLNQYRVLSAHPKDEVITAQVAESKVHLAFCFITDKATCPYEKNELACK